MGAVDARHDGWTGACGRGRVGSRVGVGRRCRAACGQMAGGRRCRGDTNLTATVVTAFLISWAMSVIVAGVDANRSFNGRWTEASLRAGDPQRRCARRRCCSRRRGRICQLGGRGADGSTTGIAATFHSRTRSVGGAGVVHGTGTRQPLGRAVTEFDQGSGFGSRRLGRRQCRRSASHRIRVRRSSAVIDGVDADGFASLMNGAAFLVVGAEGVIGANLRWNRSTHDCPDGNRATAGLQRSRG